MVDERVFQYMEVITVSILYLLSIFCVKGCFVVVYVLKNNCRHPFSFKKVKFTYSI